MADTIKSDESLHINWQFSDDDTRILRLEYPKISNLASLRSALKDYRDWTVKNQILIGDKAGASLSADSDTAIKYAYIHIATDTYLDLS